MSGGAGGRFPSDGDEADEGMRRGRRQEPDPDPETDGIEILDDGADWLASQLAALPPDTTELPIVAEQDDEPEDGAGEAPSAAANETGVDAEGDSSAARGSDAEPPTPTLLNPTVSDSAPTVAPEPTAGPPLTRPRAFEPAVEPVPTRSRRDEDARSPSREEPSPAEQAAAWPGFGVTRDRSAAAARDDDDEDDGIDDGVIHDGGPEGAEPDESAVDLAPRSARPSHPNAIVIPGLPPRPPLPTPAVTAEPVGASDASGSADEPTDASERAESPALAPSGPSELSDRIEPIEPIEPFEPTGRLEPSQSIEEPARSESSERVDDRGALDESDPAASSGAEPSDRNDVPSTPADSAPRPVGSVSTDAAETGDIDFGAFAWSLVANDEPDPRLERERLEAEAARRAAAEVAERAEAERVAALPATTTEADASSRDAAESRETDGTGWLATSALPGTPPEPSVPSAPAAVPDPGDRPDDAVPATVAMDTTPDAGAADSAGTDRPTWSRPDLDDRFPATAAMGTLPADEDPDDPDDEVDGADRASLGTTGLPVSAARAAAGSVEHVPVSSAGAGGGAAAVFPGGAVTDVDEDRPRRATPSRGGASDPSDRTRLIGLVGAGVVIVLALVALFYLGTRLPLILGGSPAAEASATPTPTPTPTPTAEAPAAGPLTAGTYAWDELRGGECLEPYESPWAEEFTVVDCAEPHAAQLVFTAPYTDDPALPFPGEDVIASEIGLLCSAPGVVDFGAAAPFTDLQVQGAYPVSGEQWAAGERDYFCFASRSSGEPLTASVATAP